MADWVDKRVQYFEKVRKQSDGDDVYRVFPWQHVSTGKWRFLEPVDFPTRGRAYSAEKEITSIEVFDEGSAFVSGGEYGTGGNVGILRG